LLALPPLAGALAWLGALRVERRGVLREHAHWAVLAIALVWVPVAYFPHSNIPVLLPTVRAERFWYVPVIGASLAIGLALARLLGGSVARGEAAGAAPPLTGARRRIARLRLDVGVVLALSFLGFQSLRARLHALDYTDDLVFWRATARAVPRSAKAHLNYGVMLGARGKLEERLVENRLAKELAPSWPMAHVYYADTLCRLSRTDEAWPHYEKGMTLGPNDRNLIALALQCLWDRGGVEGRRDALLALADAHPGTWLSYLGHDILTNGEKNGGVDRQYRPRGYDEGPGD
jgi:tetratricopeptide (TPR) repeat protein